MKKEQIVVAAAIIVVAVGLVIFGQSDNAPNDGVAKLREALKAQEVPVLVLTDGAGGASGEFLNGVKAALEGLERVRLIHVDKQNPVEREAIKQFPGAQLPTVVVIGLDGGPAHHGSAVDAEAIKAAVAEGLTKKPMEIKEHTHSDSCGHSH